MRVSGRDLGLACAQRRLQARSGSRLSRGTQTPAGYLCGLSVDLRTAMAWYACARVHAPAQCVLVLHCAQRRLQADSGPRITRGTQTPAGYLCGLSVALWPAMGQCGLGARPVLRHARLGMRARAHARARINGPKSVSRGFLGFPEISAADCNFKMISKK